MLLRILALAGVNTLAAIALCPAASARLAFPPTTHDLELGRIRLAQRLDRGDRPPTNNRAFRQGAILFEQGQLNAARDAWETALAQYQADGDRARAAETQLALGVVSDRLGDYGSAAEYLIAARDTARALGRDDIEARAVNSLGLVRANQGRYPEALTLYAAGLALQQQRGDRGGEAVSLNNLGQLYTDLGDYRRAQTFLEQALTLQRELGDIPEIISALNNLGALASTQGNYETALDYYHQGLNLAQRKGDALLEASVLGNIALTYVRRGQYPPALEAQQRALTLAQSTGVVPTEMTAYNNLGLIYHDLAQWDRAADYFERALALSRRIGDRDAEATFLANLAGVYDEQGDKQQAIARLEDALALARSVGNRVQEVIALNNLGSVYDDLNQYAPALAAYEEALALVTSLGNLYVEGRLRSNLGLVYAQQGDFARARQFYDQALAITRQVDDVVAEARVLSHLANLEFETGNVSQAEDILAATASRLADLRNQDLSDGDRVALFDTQGQVYNRYQQVMVAQGKTVEALAIAEQGRAQAFAALLTLRTGGSATPVPAAPTVADIRRIAQSQRATLVEYSLLPDEAGDGGELYIWVVAPTGEITFHRSRLASDTTPLNTLVAQTRGDMGSGLRGLGVVATSNPAGYRQLYQQLIAPIAAALPSDPRDRVVFIPQGELFQVPFPALQRPDGSYLVQHHTPLTAPSIQVLGLLPPQPVPPLQSATALVIGNPVMPQVWSPQQGRNLALAPLPGAQQEAEAIAALLNVVPLLGDDATEARVKRDIPTADIVHFATHGLLEYGQVEDSGVKDLPGAIALAPGDGEDGLLTAQEMLNLTLQANLVVLSACDTGRGRITGDGVIGLSRSLMTAGVPSVVVSLWAIPDAPTATLMTQFYESLAAGDDKAQALRQGMLATLQAYPHPRNWAAFTLMGRAD
jgi:CHAT domain-containing protein